VHGFRWQKKKVEQAIGLEIATAERLLATNVCGALRKGGSGAEAAGDGSKRQDNRANQGLQGIMIRVSFLRSAAKA
jgi:hypothetical protein